MCRTVLLSLVASCLALGTLAGRPEEKAEKPKVKIDAKVQEKIEAALPDKAPAKPKAERKLLIFSKTNGFRHDSIPVGTVAITLLGKKTGAWTATHSEDDSMFEPDKLKEFDAVLMLNTTGEVFRPAKMPSDPKAKQEVLDREARLKDSLVAFVKGGKGLAGTHSATDTYHNWGAYNDMMGGAFINHPWHTKVPIKNLAPKHPVTAAFGGKDFEIADEIYQFRSDTALGKDRKILLALDPNKMDVTKGGSRKDGQYAVSWVSTYGKGRTFYCSLGHRDEIYYNPTILKHYLAGLQYALGDLEADATPSNAKK